MTSGGNNFNDFPENKLAKFRVTFYSMSWFNNIYWSAVPAQKYLHHYTPAAQTPHHTQPRHGEKKTAISQYKLSTVPLLSLIPSLTLVL